jgi:murein DD-endopeptidase MepM/ murein hydrolase activator NlpD
MAHLIHGRHAAFSRRTGAEHHHGWAENKLFKIQHKIAIGILAGSLFLPSAPSSGRVNNPYGNLQATLLHLKGKKHKSGHLLEGGLADWKGAQIDMVQANLSGGIPFRFDGFVMPLNPGKGYRISSDFGVREHPIFGRDKFHKGMDIARPRGSVVQPARSGVVVRAGWMRGYGRVVEIRHPDGQSTIYGHLAKISVKRGDFVVRGETKLGEVGSSGLSTGPHLHFEVRDARGRPVDPTLKIGRR